MRNVMTNRIGLIAALLGLISLILFAVSVWGFRLGEWPWPQSYRTATWAVWTALAGCAVALGAGLIWLRARQGGGIAVMLGLVLSLPVAGMGIAFDLAGRMTPPINDISTDTQDPPVFWFTVTPTDYPPANAEPQTVAYPGVGPHDLELSFEEAFTLALQMVEARGWQVLSADPEESQIEAIATSPLFGFQDEVAIRISETDDGTRIDMRSRSRLGQIDRGANARRIIAFLSDLDSRNQ